MFLFVVLPCAACGDRVGGSPDPGQTAATAVAAVASAALEVEPVVREILGQIEDPAGVPGRRLTLVRYTIAPGAELDPHIHPGVQMGAIVSGTLTYRIVSGTAIVQRRVDASGVPESVEQLVGPAETDLRAGDAVVEDATLLHFGSNRTDEPVIILAALLTDSEADLSVPVAATDR